MATSGDAFGEALLDHLAGGPGAHVLERDDGLVETLEAGQYFGDLSAFSEIEAEGMQFVNGAVLDIGAGAGRFSLAAQEAGANVVALDNSSGAVEVCRQRGVRTAVLDSIHTYEPEGNFDAFIMMGHNLGLLAPDPLRSLERLAAMANPGAVIVGTTVDPYSTQDPLHLAYHAENRARGRLSGHVVLRVRTRRQIGPWFDYLFASPAELRAISERAGWGFEVAAEDPIRYLAVLRLR